MTFRSSVATALGALQAAPLSSWPGIRTFTSSRFRMVVAAVLLASATAIHLARLVAFAADINGQYGIDFRYWYGAALDAGAGLSPYPQRYLLGPVLVTDFGYKYPPLFAQVLVPITALGQQTAAHLWAAIQVLLGFLSIWLAGLFGGARRNLEFLLWAGVAVALYQPFFDTVHKGNVSAVQAFQVALLLAGGAVAGVSLTSAALLKTTPLALVPAALLHGGGLRRAMVLSAIVVVGVSFVLAPQAWLDFVRIQRNLLGGSYVIHYNLQPASLVATAMPQLPMLADVVRVLTLAVAAAALLGTLLLARRPDGWPAAVVLGVAALLLVPGAIWYHYLALLLPLAAFAWPRGSVRQRSALLAGAAGVTLGLAWLPLAAFGAAVLVVAALHIVAPRPRLGPIRRFWMRRPAG